MFCRVFIEHIKLSTKDEKQKRKRERERERERDLSEE
jgi:hypothetical protein